MKVNVGQGKILCSIFFDLKCRNLKNNDYLCKRINY